MTYKLPQTCVRPPWGQTPRIPPPWWGSTAPRSRSAGFTLLPAMLSYPPACPSLLCCSVMACLCWPSPMEQENSFNLMSSSLSLAAVFRFSLERTLVCPTHTEEIWQAEQLVNRFHTRQFYLMEPKVLRFINNYVLPVSLWVNRSWHDDSIHLYPTLILIIPSAVSEKTLKKLRENLLNITVFDLAVNQQLPLRGPQSLLYIKRGFTIPHFCRAIVKYDSTQLLAQP